MSSPWRNHSRPNPHTYTEVKKSIQHEPKDASLDSKEPSEPISHWSKVRLDSKKDRPQVGPAIQITFNIL